MHATPAVLVVDHKDSREWLSVLLASAGFTARSAANGSALLAAHDCSRK
jgi:FixJ family two-component response regulator